MRGQVGGRVFTRVRSRQLALATVLVGSGLLVLGACSGTHEHSHTPVASLKSGIIAPTANVPALLGTSIDGLCHRLGVPQPLPPDFSDPVMGPPGGLEQPDSTLAFRMKGFTLVANYDARTRQVRDLLLVGQHEDSLMGRASLRPNAATYLVLPVFQAGSANRLLGLRIVPTK